VVPSNDEVIDGVLGLENCLKLMELQPSIDLAQHLQ